MAESPNYTGTSSNVRNPASQSLQNAALGISQGGAGVAGGIGELAQSLQAQTASILKAFQKQQAAANEERDATIRQVSQSFEGAIEKMATASMRKSERQQEFAHQSQMVKETGAEQERLQKEAEGRERRQKAETAQMDAKVKEAQAKVSGFVQKAQRDSEDFHALMADIGHAKALAYLPGADPRLRALLGHLDADALASVDIYDDLPLEVAQAVDSYAAGVASARADWEAGRTETPIPDYQGPKKPGIALSQKTSDELAMAGQEMGPTPPAQARSLGYLRNAVAAIKADLDLANLRTQEEKDAYKAKMGEAAAQAEIDGKENTRIQAEFINTHDGAVDQAIYNSIMHAAIDPSMRTEVTTANGRMYTAIKGGETYKRAMEELVGKEPELAKIHQMFRTGQHAITDKTMNVVAQRYLAVNQMLSERFSKVMDTMLKDPSVEKTLRKVFDVPTGLEGTMLLKSAFDADAAEAASAGLWLNTQPYYAAQKGEEFNIEMFKRGVLKSNIGKPEVSTRYEKYGPPPEYPYVQIFEDMMTESGQGKRLDNIKKIMSTGQLPSTVQRVIDLGKRVPDSIYTTPITGPFYENLQKRRQTPPPQIGTPPQPIQLPPQGEPVPPPPQPPQPQMSGVPGQDVEEQPY